MSFLDLLKVTPLRSCALDTRPIDAIRVAVTKISLKLSSEVQRNLPMMFSSQLAQWELSLELCWITATIVRTNPHAETKKYAEAM